eukprot:2345080-Prymnesium_polylepis.2
MPALVVPWCRAAVERAPSLPRRTRPIVRPCSRRPARSDVSTLLIRAVRTCTVGRCSVWPAHGEAPTSGAALPGISLLWGALRYTARGGV